MARIGSKNTISTAVKAGLRVQKDFYGNGYTINMHNLTFPSSVIETTDKEGNIIKVPYLAKLPRSSFPADWEPDRFPPG